MGPERSERERERASDAGEAKQAAAACRRAKRAAAKQQLGRRVGARARVASWAAWGAGQRGKETAGPSEQAARCSRGQAAGTGRRSRPAREKEKEKGLGWFGWAKMEEDEFFNVKSFSKSISSISQI